MTSRLSCSRVGRFTTLDFDSFLHIIGIEIRLPHTEDRFAEDGSTRIPRILSKLSKAAKLQNLDYDIALSTVRGVRAVGIEHDDEELNHLFLLHGLLVNAPDLLRRLRDILLRNQRPRRLFCSKYAGALHKLHALHDFGILQLAPVDPAKRNAVGDAMILTANGPSQPDIIVATICMFSGTQKLETDSIIATKLARILRETRSRIWLQELHSVRLMWTEYPLLEVMTWMRLPRLKSLTIERIFNCRIADESWLQLYPSIEELVVRRSGMLADDVVWLIKTLPNLRTLSWGFDYNERELYQDFVREKPAEYMIQGEKSSRVGHWHPLLSVAPSWAANHLPSRPLDDEQNAPSFDARHLVSNLKEYAPKLSRLSLTLDTCIERTLVMSHIAYLTFGL